MSDLLSGKAFSSSWCLAPPQVQAIGNEKNKIRELVMDVMQEKLAAQFQAQGTEWPDYS